MAAIEALVSSVEGVPPATQGELSTLAGFAPKDELSNVHFERFIDSLRVVDDAPDTQFI